jgi:hypothetical protein
MARGVLRDLSVLHHRSELSRRQPAAMRRPMYCETREYSAAHDGIACVWPRPSARIGQRAGVGMVW